MEGDFPLNVLMYHGILSAKSPIPPDREVGAELYDVSEDRFRQQLAWLKKTGLDPLITFDDGEINNYSVAFPALKEFGRTAYFFIIVKRVGKPGYMGWTHIKELQEAGMRIGSHGLSHAILTNLPDSLIEEELRASKRTIEANLGGTVEDLSVPRGFCNDKVLRTAKQQGYKNVFISDKPFHIHTECQPRIAVKGSWNIKRFAMAMHGKTPVMETWAEFFKKAAKTIFRENGYNWIRKILIRISQ